MPQALIAILTNPIKSIMPVVSEVLKKNRCFESKRVFVITTTHVMRASSKKEFGSNWWDCTYCQNKHSHQSSHR
jgi:hypothetical protein